MANTDGPVGNLRPVGVSNQPVGTLRPVAQGGPVGSLRLVGTANFPGLTDFSGQEYGPSDLLEGEKFEVVDQFLRSRYGIEEIDGYTNQEKVDKFLNTMRGFSSGNTVSTFNEVDHILSGDEEARRIYGQGINLFDNLAGITSDEYTWGETADAVGDYLFGVVADPLNLVGFGAGKVFSTAGSKGMTRVVRELAKREFSRQIARGASEAVATQAANRIRTAAVKRYTTSFGRQMAVKEAVGAGVVGTLGSIGNDLAYQHGLIQTGNQEGYSMSQTGIAALGGLVSLGADVGVQSLRGVSRLKTIAPKDLSVTKANDLTGVLNTLTEELNKAPKDRMKRFFEGFDAKVRRGEELAIKDSDFFVALVGGDEELGFRGLADILLEKGFSWRGPRGKNDNFTNWLVDAMKNAPADEIKNFVRTFEDISGIKTTDLMRNTSRTVNGKRRSAIDVLGDNMARKLSDAGRVFNVMSRASKELGGKTSKSVSIDDYANILFGQDLGRKPAEELTALKRFYSKLGGGHVDYFQNLYIRMLVNHPGTTALNIAGWATKSATQSAADLLRSTVIYGSHGIYSTLKFDGKAALNDWAKLTGVYRANVRKISNLLDPYTTADSFNSIVNANPEAFRGLTEVGPGGVSRAVANEFGVATDTPWYQQKIDKVADGIGFVAGVKAQDVFTKSQEYMYNLDVLLRESFQIEGKRLDLRGLMARDDYSVLVRSTQFQKVQAEALDRTLENIMSKSYKAPYGTKPNTVQAIAGLIEDARSMPIVGVQVPFGRFFNNVVATTAELTGASPLLKIAAGSTFKNEADSLAKAAVAWTAVFSMVEREEELLRRGVAFNEDIDEDTGQRIEVSYDYPYMHFKSLARVLAHKLNGEEVPEELSGDIVKTIFGQLTRQLTGTADDVSRVFQSAVELDVPEVLNGAWQMFKSSGVVATSGLTRFLEPLNVIVALGSDPEDYVVKDLNVTGNELYKGFRYLDAYIEAFSDPNLAPKATPTEVQTSRSSGRLFGQRNLSPMTAASRVFAMIGRPDWDAGLRSDVPEATNFMTSFFQPVFEAHAQNLLNSESFLNANIEGKQARVQEVLEEIRRSIKDMLADSPKLQDRKLQLMFQLTSSRRVDSLEEFMRELGFESENIMDLSYEELELLKDFVDDEKERALRKGYGYRN